jgi:hypothetical protein
MASMFENLAEQMAKSFANHPGQWLFSGESEWGRVSGVGTEISKEGRLRIRHPKMGNDR